MAGRCRCWIKRVRSSSTWCTRVKGTWRLREIEVRAVDSGHLNVCANQEPRFVHGLQSWGAACCAPTGASTIPRECGESRVLIAAGEIHTVENLASIRPMLE